MNFNIDKLKIRTITFILFSIFILFSCGKVKPTQVDYLDVTPVSVKVSKNTNNDNISTYSGNIEELDIQDINDDSNLEKSGSGDNDLTDILNTDIISIEEQYCISKGGKIKDNNKTKVCITIKGVECDIDIFYADKCGVEDSKLNEITTNTSENISDVSLMEESVETETGTIISNKQVGKTGTYYIQTSSSGYSDLFISTNDGKNTVIFPSSSQDKIKITDYELMYNKQIKVFYTSGESTEKENIIIDLNEILNSN